MAVYTQLSIRELEALLAPLRLGRLVGTQGVAAGIENTTYFVTVETPLKTMQEFVLTIAESLSKSDIEFVAKLTRYLNRHDLPVPAPVGSTVLSAHNKPALLFPKIEGMHPRSPSPAQCEAVGRILAKLHLTTLSAHFKHRSHRSLDWVAATAAAVIPHLNADLQKRLSTELVWLDEFVSANKDLPQAVIHGDLFRDNVLVQAAEIVAIIDFFSAGTGYLLLDLAIAANDWCATADYSPHWANYRALIVGYCSTRTPSALEIDHWAELLRIAALRFWVSRLGEQLLPSPYALPGRGKNPSTYQNLTEYQSITPWPWPL